MPLPTDPPRDFQAHRVTEHLQRAHMLAEQGDTLSSADCKLKNSLISYRHLQASNASGCIARLQMSDVCDFSIRLSSIGADWSVGPRDEEAYAGALAGPNQ